MAPDPFCFSLFSFCWFCWFHFLFLGSLDFFEHWFIGYMNECSDPTEPTPTQTSNTFSRRLLQKVESHMTWSISQCAFSWVFLPRDLLSASQMCSETLNVLFLFSFCSLSVLFLFFILFFLLIYIHTNTNSCAISLIFFFFFYFSFVGICFPNAIHCTHYCSLYSMLFTVLTVVHCTFMCLFYDCFNCIFTHNIHYIVNTKYKLNTLLTISFSNGNKIHIQFVIFIEY